MSTSTHSVGPSSGGGIDPVTGKRGANQLLVGNSHGDSRAKTHTENRMQDGRLPGVSGTRVGNDSTATAVSPLGRGFSSSLEGDDSEDSGDSGDA
jgi:hypothetical protein